MKAHVCLTGKKVWVAPIVAVAELKQAENGSLVGNYDTVPVSGGHYHS